MFESKVTDAYAERRVVTVLHELAHMWFGDYVTMKCGYDTQGSFEIDNFEFAKKIALPLADKEKLSDDAKEQIITNASSGYDIIRGESAEEYLDDRKGR